MPRILLYWGGLAGWLFPSGLADGLPCLGLPTLNSGHDRWVVALCSDHFLPGAFFGSFGGGLTSLRGGCCGCALAAGGQGLAVDVCPVSEPVVGPSGGGVDEVGLPVQLPFGGVVQGVGDVAGGPSGVEEGFADSGYVLGG